MKTNMQINDQIRLVLRIVWFSTWSAKKCHRNNLVPRIDRVVIFCLLEHLRGPPNYFVFSLLQASADLTSYTARHKVKRAAKITLGRNWRSRCLSVGSTGLLICSKYWCSITNPLAVVLLSLCQSSSWCTVDQSEFLIILNSNFQKRERCRNSTYRYCVPS